MINQGEVDEFVENELFKHNLKIIPLTEELLKERKSDIMGFVNNILREFSSNYGWVEASEEYFTKPMDRKFNYSFIIINEMNEVVNLAFSSIYNDRMHLHCMYTRQDYRTKGLSKLTMIKICQKGLQDEFKIIGGFWPKTNNGSLILFLRLGMTIDYMRNNVELFLKGDLEEIANNAIKLLKKNTP